MGGLMFTHDNHARMGNEYHSIQGKPQDPHDHYCTNLAKPGHGPLGKSGTDATNYLNQGKTQIESTGRTRKAVYTTADE
jgi:hypothetical protein